MTFCSVAAQSATVKYIDQYGVKDKRTVKAHSEMADQIMELKLAPKLFDALVRNLRDVVSIIRSQERLVMQICVRQAGMPRKDFISSFPRNETNLDWVEKHIRAKRKHSSQLAKLRPEIERAQRKVEAHNFDIRKNLLEYDDVANDQRKVVYVMRNDLMEAEEIEESICVKVEEEIYGVDGIKRVTSTATEGAGAVTVEA